MKYPISTISFLLSAILVTGCSKLEKGYDYLHSGESRLEKTGEEAATGTLPLVRITTTDGKGVTDKTSWKDGTLRIGEEPVAIQIKGRGNSSWNFPKKPFNVKFDASISFLGMPASDKWCFLANWRDPTLLRNAVSLEMARATSLDWTPEGRFVEVLIDGVFMGNYYVTEKVEPDEGKFDVGAGGFLLCMDSYYEATYRFKTKKKELPVNLTFPGDAAPDKDSWDAVKKRINAVEKAVCAGDGTGVVDVDSFCDWLLVHEVTGNDEPCKPHSVYMHTRAGEERMVAGPAWDFDYHTFRPGIGGWINRKAVWFDTLLADPAFCARLKERYAILRPLWEETIPAFIDKQADAIAPSARQDLVMWPKTLPKNGDEDLSFDNAVIRMKEAFGDRLETVDKLVNAL